MEPRTDLIIRAEIDDSNYYIEKRRFRDYLTDGGISIHDFIFKMKEKGHKIQERKKRMGAGWKPATGFSSVTSIEINTSKFVDPDIFKGVKAETT